MAKTSIYLKGREKYPDATYHNRLKEFSQEVNPKPEYVAPEPAVITPVDWKVTFKVADVDLTVKASGLYVDTVVSRAIQSLPMGLLPRGDEPLTITFEAI